MKYLDTNILLYAIENHPTYGSASARILFDIERRSITAGTSSLTLLETIGALRKINNMLLRKRKKILDIQANVEAILSLPIVWFDMSMLIVEKSAALAYPAQTADHIHIATMELNNIKEIFSADQDFGRIPGIVRIDPLEY